MTGLLTRRLLPLLALLCFLILAPVAAACPFCSMQGQTLTQEVNQASMVLYGTLSNARLTGGDLGEGKTDLHIEKVLKSPTDAAVKVEIADKLLTLKRYLPIDKNNTQKLLVFCDVYKGKIDPYRGMPVPANSAMPEYLAGAVKLKGAPIGRRLKFCFDYLDNPDSAVATDAYMEFANADYKEYADMAKELPPEKVAEWLKDPKTPSFRFGLYASMLGHCSKDKATDAKLLRSLVEDPKKRVSSGIDGILAGYVMLQPKEGWQFVRGILDDGKKEFMLRYAALRTIRFFVDYRPDVVSKKDAVEAAALLLDQGDIADLAIEDLRKWKCWEMTDRVLALEGKESHDVPIVKRAVLRFALRSPKESAKKFVAAARERDAQLVSDAEELLKLEQGPTTANPN